MAEQATTPATNAARPNPWKRATTGLAVVAALAILGPVLASVLAAREPTAPGDKGDEKKEEQPADESPTAGAQSTGGSAVGLRSGGGSGSSGSTGAANFDVMACNRAAAAARKQSEGTMHPGLASALDAAGGGLLGATAQSLHSVQQQTDDDARAAEAYRACISQR